jgi:hypothetical protein
MVSEAAKATAEAIAIVAASAFTAYETADPAAMSSPRRRLRFRPCQASWSRSRVVITKPTSRNDTSGTARGPKWAIARFAAAAAAT